MSINLVELFNNTIGKSKMYRDDCEWSEGAVEIKSIVLTENGRIVFSSHLPGTNEKRYEDEAVVSEIGYTYVMFDEDFRQYYNCEPDSGYETVLVDDVIKATWFDKETAKIITRHRRDEGRRYSIFKCKVRISNGIRGLINITGYSICD